MGEKPPEIIVFHWIKMSQSIFCFHKRHNISFASSASQKPVAGHDPSQNGAVLFDSLFCVFRTGGSHGAAVSINGRNMFLVQFHQRIVPGMGRANIACKQKGPEKSQPPEKPPPAFILGKHEAPLQWMSIPGAPCSSHPHTGFSFRFPEPQTESDWHPRFAGSYFSKNRPIP